MVWHSLHIGDCFPFVSEQTSTLDSATNAPFSYAFYQQSDKYRNTNGYPGSHRLWSNALAPYLSRLFIS